MADFLASLARLEAGKRFYGDPFDLAELFTHFSDTVAYNMFLPAFIDKDSLSNLVAARKLQSRQKRAAKIQSKQR